jgi:pyrophosphatase PpaX
MLRWPAIVFDLDGTLIDTIPLILESHRHAVRTVLGREALEDELRTGIGRPLMTQMRELDAERAEELHDAYRVWNHANTAAYLGGFEGLDDVLRQLHAAGARIAIATSKMRDAVDLAFALQPAPIAFDAVVTLEDTDRHKPDPEPILTAQQRLGAAPADGVYVGDTRADMRAARAACTGAVGVTWGVATADELAAEGPDAIVATPAELYAVLNSPPAARGASEP